MRLAVDARNLIHPRSGIARSIENAVQALTGSVREIHLCLPGGLHPDFAYLAGLDGVHVHTVNRPSPLGRVWWGTADLPLLLRRIRPSVFWGPAHKLSSAAAAVAPSVLTIHDLVWKFAPETMRLYRRLGDEILTRRALSHASQVIAVSARTAADLAAVFPQAAAKTVVVPNIVRPLAGPEPRASLLEAGITGDFCLFAGTVEPRKNLPRTVRAYLGLPEELRRRFRLVIAGGQGWKSADFQELVARHAGDILYLGRVSEQRLATLYAHCSFVVMPSLYEGFGYPAIEAKLCGKMLLTSQGSPMASLAGPGTVLADPLDEASIAAGFEDCMRLCGHADPRPLMAHAASFDAPAIAPQLIRVFEKAQKERL